MSERKTKSKPERILQIGVCDETFGGIEKVILNWYENIDRDKFQFDFLSPYKSTYESHRKEIESLGGRIYTLGVKRDSIYNKIRYGRALRYFLKEHQYKVVHINTGLLLSQLQIALVCRRARVPIIISHSHNDVRAHFPKSLLINILKPVLFRITNVHLTCSKAAAYSIFPRRRVDENQIIQINNGIVIDDFKFNVSYREKWRKKIGLGSAITYIHVGRFYEQKNHKFLIEIFAEIHKRQPDSKLVLVGEGPLQNAIKKLVCRLGISDSVIFLGTISRVNEILSAADIFILPSLFEGLPVVGIEAQAAGLPTFYSTEISREVEVTNHVYPILLNSSAKEWSEIILSKQPFKIDRFSSAKKVYNAGYDAVSCAKEIEEIYVNYA